MIRCVLFDFDGTVFDTVEGITKSVQYAARKQGLDPELNELRCFAGPPLVDMFMEHFGFTQAAAEQAVVVFRERYNPIGLYECRVFPGMKEALLELRRRGYLVGIATSKPQVLAEELLGREGMLPLFDGIVGSSTDGNNNSKADVLSAVMEKLSVTPEETVLAGDTEYDGRGAKACDVAGIGVGWGYAAEGELEQAGADRIVPNLEALLAQFPERNLT